MALTGLPLINGKAYEYADITCIILGVPIIQITSIEYGEDAAVTNIYSTGRFPTSRIHGKIEPSAKMTILFDEIQNIMSVAPQGRLYQIPEFDIIIAYTDLSLIPVVHTLKNVRFKNNMLKASTGDDAIPIDVDLVISHIDYGI